MISHLVRLILVCALVFFGNLGGSRLMDRDEPRNAGCAFEMLERADWVVPTFNAELRTHKPVLTYWLMMAAYRVFGVNEFAARFWSAMLGTGTVLLTYGIGRRLFDPATGFIGGLATASAFFFAVSSRIATPDAPLIFFSTLAMFIYVMGAFRAKVPAQSEPADTPQATVLRDEANPFPSWRAALLIYATLGLATLAKGPVGLVIPMAVIGMFLLIVRLPQHGAAAIGAPTCSLAPRLAWLRPFAPLHFIKTCWSMRPLTALAVAAAVALPWYVKVHQATHGEWTDGFFRVHNLGRFTQAMEGHGGSGLLYLAYLLYYPVLLCVAFFPWSCFMIPSLGELGRRIKSNDPWRTGLILTACWAGVWVGAFSLARTKLPSYITPMYPALALITAVALRNWRAGREQTDSRFFKWAFGVFAGAGLLMCIGVPVGLHVFAPGAEWLGVVGAVPLVLGLAGWKLITKGRREKALPVFAAGSVSVTAFIMGFLLPYLDTHYQQSHRLLDVAAANRIHADKPATLVCFEVLEPSWVFNARRPIREFGLHNTADLTAALKQEDTFLITRESSLKKLATILPQDFAALVRIPYYMKTGPGLVLLGRPVAAAQTGGTAPAATGPAR